MQNDKASKAYVAIVAEAEQAVAAVKDPELRRVAFERILTTLLDRSTSVTAKAGGSRAKGSQGTKASTPDSRPKTARGGVTAYLKELIEDDFFKKQRSIAEVKAELANRGHHIPLTSLSGPLQRLVQQKSLRRQKVAGNGKGGQGTYAYSNW